MNLFNSQKYELDIFNSTGSYSFLDLSASVLTQRINDVLGDMKYDGKYKWFGSWENHARQVLTLFLLKGDSAIWEWGWNYDFLPEIHSGKICYFRTDRSVKGQLRDLPQPFVNSTNSKKLKSNWKPYKMPLHSHNEEKLKDKIIEVWNRTSPSISAWYERVNSYETALAELERQILYGEYYSLLSPCQNYIKAFLQAYIGKLDEGAESLHQSYEWQNARDDLKEKLEQKLMELTKLSGRMNDDH